VGGGAHSLPGEGVGGHNSDEGTESLVLYVYYNPCNVNTPTLYKPVFTQVTPKPSIGTLPAQLAVHGDKRYARGADLPPPPPQPF
jgi:hypothetical protein